MADYEEIYREAFADALAENLDGDRLDDLTPEQSETAVAYAKEYAAGEVEAARALGTSGCPVGARCESCGAEGAALAVTTVPTTVGVLCLTQCPRCAAAPVTPPMSPATAARLVDQHRTHLEAEK